MRFRIILIISIIILLIFIFIFTHKVGEDLYDFTECNRLISANTTSYYIINFQVIADSGFSFNAQEGVRGKYFAYLEDSIGIIFENDCRFLIVVEMLKDKTQFGINGDLNKSKDDCYFLLNCKVNEDQFKKYYRKKFNSDPETALHRDRYIYDIPAIDEGKDSFKITFLPGNYVLMGSNMMSIDTAINVYYGEIESILDKPELDKIFTEIPKDLPTWGYFSFDGRNFPADIEKKLPGSSGLRYVIISNSMDTRMNIMKFNFHLNNVDSLGTFTESIYELLERVKKENPNRTDHELLSQVRIDKTFKSLNVTFYFTHEQQLRIEKIIRQTLMNYLAE